MKRVLLLLLLSACSTSETATPPPPAGDAGTPPPREDASSSATVSPCAVTRAFVERCGADLNCGPAGFDAWCAANDAAINSDAFRRAEAACLPTVECDAKKRDACEEAHYATETPTAAQRAVVAAYCASCEPGVATCAADAVSDPKKDIYVAAWELADPVVDEIRTRCTGAALDAGASCEKAFGSCAAEVYLDRVPNCP